MYIYGGRHPSPRRNSIRTVIVACAFAPLLLVSCVKSPLLATEHGVTLHLLPDRDVAEVLLAHCEGAIALAQAIESSPVGPEVKSLAKVVADAEQRDYESIATWIKGQTDSLLFAGEIHAREIRTAHAGMAEQLAARKPPELDGYARRLLVAHYNEEVAEIRRTPAKDKTLRRIADEMRRRMTEQLRQLERPSGATSDVSRPEGQGIA